MVLRSSVLGCVLLAGLAGCAIGNEPAASTEGAQLASKETTWDPLRVSWPQNATLTIDRGASRTVRLVAYGDSIFAGYQGSPWDVARRSAPYVAAEYLGAAWGTNVEVIRRTLSGAVASEVVSDMTSEHEYMQDESTRAVYFEMCGNDYLKARHALDAQHGRCNYGDLDDALASCVLNTQRAMETVNQYATTAQTKAVMNLYYPGWDNDDAKTSCTDPTSGRPAVVRDLLLPRMAQSNWRTCNLARHHGFACVDAFAEMMGADYDANGDGKIDSDALRFDPNESEDAYVKRVSVTLKGTLRDAKRHALSPGNEVSYLYSDGTHPNNYLDMVQASSETTAPPDFTSGDLATGANPQWNRYGHERLGWAFWKTGPQALH